MTKFTLGGISFNQTRSAPTSRGTSTEDEFVIVKSDDAMAFYQGLKSAKPKNIMEIGMYEGGSLVWLDKLFKPKRIVGLDMRKDPILALENYRQSNPQVVTYYQRSQDKPGTLMAARQNFPDGIDLVVDDASHHYDKSRATFLMLFPLVRTGGQYVIENWGWSHRPGAQKPDAVWSHLPALTNLIFELTLLAATTGVVSEVRVMRDLVSVKKGKGVFKPEMLDFTDSLRGRPLPQI